MRLIDCSIVTVLECLKRVVSGGCGGRFRRLSDHIWCCREVFFFCSIIEAGEGVYMLS